MNQDLHGVCAHGEELGEGPARESDDEGGLLVLPGAKQPLHGVAEVLRDLRGILAHEDLGRVGHGDVRCCRSDCGPQKRYTT